MTEMLPEHVRRAGAMAAMWGGWLVALGLFVYATITYDPAAGKFAPQWITLAFIFAIGVAIAGSTARARQRIASTILSAMEAGREEEREAARERARFKIEIKRKGAG